MAPPAAVTGLIERFDSHRQAYRSGQYNEAQLRGEFLNPFFEALGWDVYNRKGYAEAYKEVIHEAAVKVGGRTKAPDYCFRAGGGVRSFFVEAKKPSVDIRDAVSPAYQLRRYAWSAKLPVSILTDFEELAVYDCRIRPVKTDKAATARVIYRRYTEYRDCWDELAGLFSPEAIRRGELEKFIASKRVKKGTAEVDAAFLDEIETWRELLARNIALRNKGLSQRDLNFAVQRTIDRMVFLRICEDRGIEPYGRLQSLHNGPNVYRRLADLFQQADDRYNSGLFYFTPEKGRADPPDELTLSLQIDDKPLKAIIKNLYYPDSPYEFSVLPAEILGQVYEQFLGKVIRLTKGHQAKVEQKPEVRKAGGVYYTPKYIVDYIVRHTVGKLLGGDCPDSREAKMGLSPSPEPKSSITPKKAAKLRILDPACGSGSFLIGAYQHLLDWHLDQYLAGDPEKHARGRPPRLYRSTTDDWRLTTAEKKRILLNNIYGVDIDPQAVEVTKLSLLLKVLEGESQQTLSNQLRLFHERALPDLSSNIKCGNSLIGPDFYDDRQMTLLDEEERYRINVFDWNAEFPDVFKGKAPGFDAVIGNPPYVDVKILGDDVKKLLSQRFRAATRRFDLYVPFVEQGLLLLCQAGLLGFIMPSMFSRRDYGRDLRAVIADVGRPRRIVDFGSNQVFLGPMNYVAVHFIERSREGGQTAIVRCDCHDLTRQDLCDCLEGTAIRGVQRFQLPVETFRTALPWYLRTEGERKLVDRVHEESTPLGELLVHASEGIHSGKDAVFFLSIDRVAELGLECPPVYPLAKGKDVHRYEPVTPRNLRNAVVYPYDHETGDVLPESVLEEMAPNTWRYLEGCRGDLRGRSYFDKSNKRWYELWCQRSPNLYTAAKIMGPEIAARGEFTLCENTVFVNNKVKALIPIAGLPESIRYLLGLLNSSLMAYVHRLTAPPKGGGFFEVKTRVLGTLPIRRVDFTKRRDTARHDRIVELVEQMLSLHNRLESTKTAHAKTVLQRQIDATDRQIDRLVYEFYDLTNEEIAIVEQATQ